ncbi:DUF850 domain-containing [Pyrenophora seminiperda CCB06]|uniref:ER membrane protein complex subunit 3 n=1 Tax=Pyrenophora seminiperda CCB06 TaxID=1302712 RepID=A0A3M7LX62_9PLEO|nr:DUF850 domain-containing [Pyrenophora seminiperda CCB06]
MSPIGEGAIQEEVGNDGWEGEWLAGFPTELPVVVEERTGDGDGCVAEDQSCSFELLWWMDTFPQGQSADPGHPAGASAVVDVAHQQPTDLHPSTSRYIASSPSTAGTMAQPVVQTIHRDPALFWWILLPITVVMVLTGILRHYAMTLLQTTPKKQELAKIRQQRSLIRGVNLRTNAQVLSPDAFATRKAYMVQAYQEGKFLAEPELRGKPRPNPMSDPAAMEGMMGMMKGQMTMMIPQTLIMGWINAFFSGFVISESPHFIAWFLAHPSSALVQESNIDLANRCRSTVKLPFPLTPQFKSMLQSGVGTRDLDVRWVSSLSWYFLTLFGLQPVYNFILGSNNAANQVTQQMAMANPGAGGMMGPEQDPDKLFLSEAENLEVLEHRWILDGIEDRLIANMEA